MFNLPDKCIKIFKGSFGLSKIGCDCSKSGTLSKKTKMGQCLTIGGGTGGGGPGGQCGPSIFQTGGHGPSTFLTVLF